MDEELSPQQAERVRRLLADARHTEPVPADVATRLDRVLADLEAERAEGSSGAAAPPTADGAGVVRLDERRRKVGRLLLAAAVVVVGGVAVGQLVDGVGGADGGAESMSGADESAARPAPERNEAAGEPEAGDTEDRDEAPVSGAVSQHRYSIARQSAQLVRSDQFTADARRLRDVATGRGTAADQPASPELGSVLTRDGRCAPGVWGGGRYLRVVFDREAGWLVYRPPQGDTQVVDLFLCGEDSAERSATLPRD